MEIAELTTKLLALNVNDYTEEKNGLTYLSWANAWKELLKVCPSATYEIRFFKDKDGVEAPYCGNPEIGYMVFTEMTIEGVTRKCYLPVMDNRNKSILAPQSTDINKAIMRCLAKNIAMFGLGLYVYAGEDLPDEIANPITDAQIAEIEMLGVNVPNVLARFKKSNIKELTEAQAAFVIETKRKQGAAK